MRGGGDTPEVACQLHWMRVTWVRRMSVYVYVCVCVCVCLWYLLGTCLDSWRGLLVRGSRPIEWGWRHQLGMLVYVCLGFQQGGRFGSGPLLGPVRRDGTPMQGLDGTTAGVDLQFSRTKLEFSCLFSAIPHLKVKTHLFQSLSNYGGELQARNPSCSSVNQVKDIAILGFRPCLLATTLLLGT